MSARNAIPFLLGISLFVNVLLLQGAWRQAAATDQLWADHCRELARAANRVCLLLDQLAAGARSYPGLSQEVGAVRQQLQRIRLLPGRERLPLPAAESIHRFLVYAEQAAWELETSLATGREIGTGLAARLDSVGDGMMLLRQLEPGAAGLLQRLPVGNDSGWRELWQATARGLFELNLAPVDP